MVEISQELLTDPAHESHFTVAQALAGEAKLLDACGVLMRALDLNPALDRARLLLARLFFEIGAPRFAAREVRELVARNPALKSLGRLGEALEPGVAMNAQTVTKRFAETSFNPGEISALENIKKTDS